MSFDITTPVRAATEDDIDALVGMAMRFQQDMFSAHLFATPESFRALATTLIASPISEVFVDERGGVLVGMLGVSLYHQSMSRELIGSELCWWVEPEARGGLGGIRLLRHAEQWARLQGAVAFQMGAPTPAIGEFYERIGYTRIETIYQKRFAA